MDVITPREFELVCYDVIHRLVRHTVTLYSLELVYSKTNFNLAEILVLRLFKMAENKTEYFML